MLVPVPVQQQIVAQAPALAYAPTTLPSGWRFSSWFATDSMLEIVFRRRGGGEVDFFVFRLHGACSAGSLAKVGGVFWSRTVTRPSAWRWAEGRKLVAGLFPADRLAQPALLRFVASARHLGCRPPDEPLERDPGEDEHAPCDLERVQRLGEEDQGEED